MEKYMAIACGGALGALARSMVGEWVMARLGPYPFGTIVVNLIGCLIIGIILGAYVCRPDWPQWVRFFLVVGGLGAFTTFSTFSLEAVTLFDHEKFVLGGIYIILSVSACIVGVYCGRKIATMML